MRGREIETKGGRKGREGEASRLERKRGRRKGREVGRYDTLHMDDMADS